MKKTTENQPKVKVVYENAKTYNQEEIDNAVKSLFSQLGGIKQFVPQNAKVLLKANLVRDMHPDLAGTTHPSVLLAIVKILIEECNAQVIVGDSSGGAYTKAYMNTVYNKCQMTYVAENSSAVLNQNFDFQTVDIGGQKLLSSDVISVFLDADVVLNVTKLKSHSYTGFTGAVKNHYGLLAGLTKVKVHSLFPKLDDFCNVLVDIEQFAKSKVVLNVIDAVVGMEGDGPTNGTPKFLGKLFASTNPYLLDFVAASLFCDPLTTPLQKVAQQRGLLDISKIDCDLSGLKSDFVTDFERVDILIGSNLLGMSNMTMKLLKNHLSPKVVVKHKICRRCGKCRDHCPQNAITLDKKIKIDQSKCVRCFCCQELCPFDAVKLKKSLFYRIIRKASLQKQKREK